MKPIWNNLNPLLKLTLPHIKKIILAVVCVLIVNAAELIKPYILKIIIDDFLIKKTTETTFYSIAAMGILYFIVAALGGIFLIAQTNIINKAGQEITKDLRAKVFNLIQYLPLSYIDKVSSGFLITRATNDIEALSQMYTDVIISLFKDIFLLIGIVYAMLVLDVKLALVSFSVIPFMFIIIFFLKNKIKSNFSKIKSIIGKINGFMSENISGMKLIQIFSGEEEKREEFTKLNEEYFKSSLFQVRLNSMLRPAAEVFQGIAVAIIIWYSIDKIAGETLPIGVVYAFTAYIKQFFAPVSDLADNYTTIQSAMVSADRIFELLGEEENLEDLNKGVSIERFNGDIEFKNVWFSYNNKEWVLKDISFKINKGEKVAIIGETGSGKSTIINLISGLYKVQKGTIFIDGINIEEIKKKELRKNIAVVLQEVFLFSETIHKNITLKDEIEEMDVKKAIEQSKLSTFIDSLPLGFETPVMERGNRFSTGERQLISLGRALAHKPAILILDEATSNIDTTTEKQIEKAIEIAAKECTVVTIAHRLSTIKNADKIIVLNSGEIVEIGTHNELLNKNGGKYYYYSLNNEKE